MAVFLLPLNIINHPFCSLYTEQEGGTQVMEGEISFQSHLRQLAEAVL